MCEGCHGIEGWRTAFPEVYQVPKIGGQHEAYIVKALQEYKSRRAQPSVDARDRGVAVGQGHGRPRRVLLARAAEDGEQMTAKR